MWEAGGGGRGLSKVPLVVLSGKSCSLLNDKCALSISSASAGRPCPTLLVSLGYYYCVYPSRNLLGVPWDASMMACKCL